MDKLSFPDIDTCVANAAAGTGIPEEYQVTREKLVHCQLLRRVALVGRRAGDVTDNILVNEICKPRAVEPVRRRAAIFVRRAEIACRKFKHCLPRGADAGVDNGGKGGQRDGFACHCQIIRMDKAGFAVIGNLEPAVRDAAHNNACPALEPADNRRRGGRRGTEIDVVGTDHAAANAEIAVSRVNNIIHAGVAEHPIDRYLRPAVTACEDGELCAFRYGGDDRPEGLGADIQLGSGRLARPNCGCIGGHTKGQHSNCCGKAECLADFPDNHNCDKDSFRVSRVGLLA